MKTLNELIQKMFRDKQKIHELESQQQKIACELDRAYGAFKDSQSDVIKEAKASNGNSSPKGKIIYIEDTTGVLWAITLGDSSVQIDKCETVVRMEKPRSIAVKADR